MKNVLYEIDDKRIIDDTWNFKKANTKEYSHCYHPYPAMMIPQVARRLIKEFQPEKLDLLFDPYVGSGTSLVEAKLFGINSIGTDLNPLARLMAKVKSTTFNIDKLYKTKSILIEAINHYKENEQQDLPNFKNIDFWFSLEIQKKLAFLKAKIDALDVDVKDFYTLILSETVREASFTRNSEFKLYRIPETQIPLHEVDTFSIFIKKVTRNITGSLAFNSKAKQNVYAKVFNFNTCEGIPPTVLAHQEVDMIVTSPPYGDSRTTVAYGQFSRLSNEWLGVEEANQIDKNLMGGIRQKNVRLELESIEEKLNQIKIKDEKRVLDVVSFLIDYQNSINNICPLVRKKGRVCYVVGNRRVKGIQIDLDLATVEIFQKNGFKHLKTIVRGIPSKKMPSKNSPTNEVGKLMETMNNEYIVILEKE